MTKQSSSASTALALLIAAATAVPSSAGVIIEDFSNYTSGGNVAAWADSTTTFTPGPTEWTVDVAGGGFGFHFDDTGNPGVGIDISGKSTLELDVTVNSGGEFGTTVIVVLQDINGVQDAYDFGALLGNLPAGFSGTLSTPLTLPGNFDTTGLDFFQLQGNSFATNFPVAYSLTFDELRVVPEPATGALLGLGALLAVRRRRP